MTIQLTRSFGDERFQESTFHGDRFSNFRLMQLIFCFFFFLLQNQIVENSNDHQIGGMFCVNLPWNQCVHGTASVLILPFIHDLLQHEICVRGEFINIRLSQCKVIKSRFLFFFVLADETKSDARRISQPPKLFD